MEASRSAGCGLLLLGFLCQSMACASPCEDTGVVKVASAADLSSIADCEVMLGQLLVEGASDIVDFSLPLLKEIAGAIYFNGNDNLVSARFDALELVDHTGIPRAEQTGIAFQLNPKLQTVSLPALTTVGSATRPGGIGFSLNPELETLEVPLLERLFGGVGFWRTSFRTLSFPRLKRLTELSVSGNIPLESVSLPSLEVVEQGVRLSEQDLLHTLELPALRSIGTQKRGALAIVGTGITALRLPALESVALSFTVEENFALETIEVGGPMDAVPVFIVSHNASLATLSVPHVLEIGTFRVQVNGALSELKFNELRKVEYLEVTANPKLPTCDVDALVAQLKDRDGVKSVINEQNLEGACGG